MEEGRQVEAVQAKSMKGFLWFGSAGVALAIGGLIALLAANWYTIPFAVQVTVAMAPLVTAWGVYAWMLWRGVTSLAAHEVLGVLWIKDIYPRMAKWILKIPNRAGKILTWCLTAFLIVNAAVTCVAVARWSQRVQGEAADGPFWSFVDQRFPDQRMERIFANMEFGQP